MSKEKIEQNLINIRGFLGTHGHIFGPKVELFKKIVGYSEYCIKSEVSEVESKYVQDVMQSLDILQYLYVNEPISNELISFVKEYSLLIFNINSNIMKSSDISNKCRFIERIYGDVISIKELFVFMKELIKKYNAISIYALPSVELSKHYLESFKSKESTEVLSEEKKICKPESAPKVDYSKF